MVKILRTINIINISIRGKACRTTKQGAISQLIIPSNGIWAFMLSLHKTNQLSKWRRILLQSLCSRSLTLKKALSNNISTNQVKLLINSKLGTWPQQTHFRSALLKPCNNSNSNNCSKLKHSFKDVARGATSISSSPEPMANEMAAKVEHYRPSTIITISITTDEKGTALDIRPFTFNHLTQNFAIELMGFWGFGVLGFWMTFGFKPLLLIAFWI